MRLWGSSASAGELAQGQEFHLSRGGSGIVGEKLGEGGQGAVYRCDIGGRQLALKWYHPHVVVQDGTLRQRLDRLISKGPPDKRFLFPSDLATIEGRGEFGYVMPVVSPDRKPLDEIVRGDASGKRLLMKLEIAATMCFEIAEAFQALHGQGLSYQDLNFGAFFVDPIRGGVLICDPDNITVEGLRGGVLGTWSFMAPEVAMGEFPSSRTDLHSMAVLFFYVLFLCHPYGGKRFAAVREWTDAAKRGFYGEDPLFMFDPANDQNGPIAGQHDWVKARWNAMPASLRKLFETSFTEGLQNPDQRVAESAWRGAMSRLRDAVMSCPNCGFEIPLDAAADEGGTPTCTSCQKAVPRPARLALGRRYLVSMLPTRQLLTHHIDWAARVRLVEAVAAVDAHPTDAAIIGLRNLTAAPWQGRTGEGRVVPVMPGRTVRISPGLGIDFGGSEGVVSGPDGSVLA